MQNNNLLSRFLGYVGFDTQSKPSAKHSPSSAGQMKLAEALQQELLALGLQDVKVSKHAVVTAYLPANRPELKRTIGLIIVADGNTLLGADNKAGIAEIMTALEILQKDNLPHCHIRVAFTPDEEIGLGIQYFPLEDFPCDWAYTIDGGAVGELEYENFNAALAKVIIHGRAIHPGFAKGKMVNALTLACAFQQGLPAKEVPELTEGKEGFFHLDYFSGDVERVEMHYLIRDFDAEAFNARKTFLQNWAAEFNRQHKLRKPLELQISDNYRNMYDCVEKVPQAIEVADRAMRKAGITPNHQPIRGGTDGAFLAEKGLACPNIFTGGYNFHSKHELVSLQGMEKAVEVIVNLVQDQEM